MSKIGSESLLCWVIKPRPVSFLEHWAQTEHTCTYVQHQASHVTMCCILLHPFQDLIILPSCFHNLQFPVQTATQLTKQGFAFPHFIFISASTQF